MAEETVAPPTPFEEAIVSLVGGEDAIHDSFFYLCGRLLSKKAVVIPSFSAAISNVWGLRERVLIRQEEEDIFVFQFKDRDVKNRILSGGPWFYNNSMLLLADYDGVSALTAAPLHLLEVWVAVKGLRIAMRNEKALTLIGGALGTFVRVDQGAVQRKDPIQRVRVIQDVRRRIWARRIFEFSPAVSVMVDLQYEKCHGLCAACGLFGHGGGVCDRRLEMEALPLAVSGSNGLDCGLNSALRSPTSVAEVGGPGESHATSPGLAALEVAATKAGLGSTATASRARDLPEFSAGNPKFKLGLTAKVAGLIGSELQSVGLGLNFDGAKSPGGPGSVGKHSKAALGVKRKQFKPSLAIIPREFELGELVEVPVSLGPAPKKRGRPRKHTLANEIAGNKAGSNKSSNSTGKELVIV